MMKNIWSVGVVIVGLLGSLQADPSLVDARKGHVTKLAKSEQEREPLSAPPEKLFSLVKYKGEKGQLSAYVSKPRDLKKKNAAIIWIPGGFPAGGIGESAWKALKLSNDQSAKQ